jgi:predicted nucleic acid-binding protein
MTEHQRFFLDTNVLVYAFDNDEPEKKERALEILRTAGETQGAYVISTQVLQEFYTVVTRRLSKNLTEEEGERAVRSFAVLPVVTADAHLVLDAITLSRRYRLSLWDALIVQAAIKTDCTTVLTEDLQDGLEIGDLRIANPFLSSS